MASPGSRFDVTLRYDEAVVRAAARASWRHALGARFVAALALAAAGLGTLLAQGERSWLVGMLGTVLVLGLAFAVAAYLVPLRASLRRLAAMATPQARLHGDASRFTIDSDLGAVHLPWSAVRRLRRHPTFWLLDVAGAAPLTIPLDGVAAEDRSCIAAQIERAHGKPGPATPPG